MDKKDKIKERVANKQHTCFICKGDIDIGEVYTEVTMVMTSPYSKRKSYLPVRICIVHHPRELGLK